MGVEDGASLHTLDEALARPASKQNVLVAAVVDRLDMERIQQCPDDPQCVSDKVKDLLSEIVFSAEGAGTPVRVLAINGSDPRVALAAAARALECRRESPSIRE